MTDYALDALLAPIDDATPTGPDLEYDADFMALERAASAKAERVMGDEVKAAEEPDWDDVASMALALLRRSKDLRIAVPLSIAWLRTTGMPGWAAGMALTRGLLENFWDGVYPQLDAEDDNDPTARVNAVVPISDLQGALGYLQSTPFVQSPRLGRFSLRDVRIAAGELKPATTGNKEGDGSSASMAEIEACCMDCSEEAFRATLEAVNASLEHVRAIDKVFNEHVGTAGPELKPLLADLQELKKFLEPQWAKRHPDAVAETGGEGEASSEGTDGAATTANNGRINGPQDVARRIDEICEYYARVEPSSPVPLLLRRAQRLVGMSFADLLQDLAPSGLNELKVVSGKTDQA